MFSTKRMRVVHAQAAVVLPTALVGDIAVAVLAGDDVVKVAPHAFVHRMDEAPLRVRPAGGPFLAEGVGGRAVEIGGFRIVIGVAGEDLLFAVDEQLVRGEALRDFRPLNAVAVRLPGQIQPPAAADHDLFAGRRRINNRRLFRAGVLGCKYQGRREVVGSAVEPNGNRPHGAGLERPYGLPRGGEAA